MSTQPSEIDMGKLNNIDEHFSHIHAVNNQIQLQLHNIEVQSKQTGADVGQLCDRSKNNNQNLNKLLQNIASYSEEVITEGNATKQDIHGIVTMLSEIKKALGELQEGGSSEGLKSLSKENRNIRKVLEESKVYMEKIWKTVEDNSDIKKILVRINDEDKRDIIKIVNNNQSGLQESITENLTKIHGETAKIHEETTKIQEDVVLGSRAIRDDIRKVLEEHSISNAEKLDKVLRVLNETRISQPSEEISKALKSIETQNVEAAKSLESIGKHSQGLAQIIEPIVDKIDHSNIENQLHALLDKQDTMSSSTSKLDSKLSILTSKDIESDAKLINMEAMLTSIQGDLKAQKIAEKVEQMEEKYAQLENKYNKLSQLYSEKLSAFTKLHSDYQDLLNQVDSIEVKSDSKIAKVRQLHVSKMNEFKESGRIKMNKRVVSVPVRKIEGIAEQNNSE